MKGLYFLAIATVAVLPIVASQKQIPTQCPLVDSPNHTVHLAHEYDCTKFYKCLSGVKIVMDCPWMNKEKTKRLHFDPVEQVCNWPGLAGCKFTTPPVDKKNTNSYLHDKCPEDGKGDVKLPHELYCERYYQCEDGLKCEKWCPDNQHFDSQRRVCDRPEDANCNLSTLIPIQTTTTPKPVSKPKPTKCPPKGSNEIVFLPHECICELYYKCEDGKQVVETCEDGLHFNRETDKCDTPENAKCEKVDIIPNQCPATGIVNIPHESECDLYYECIEGTKIHRKCPAGLHFHKLLEMCDTKENAKCELNNDGKVTETIPTEPTSTTTNNIPHQCPVGDNDEETYIPHESDCSKYYICYRGFKHESKCLTGLHFNPETKECDIPENAKCDKSITVVVPTTTPRIVDSICPADSSGSITLVPHPGSCTLYYECQNGRSKLMECSKGLRFNKEILLCDWEDNVSCDITDVTSTVKSSTTTTDPSTTTEVDVPEIPTVCPPKGSKDMPLFPHECLCDRYYLCRDGLQILLRCPIGHHFNEDTQLCHPAKGVKCERSFHDQVPDFGNDSTSEDSKIKEKATTEVTMKETTVEPTVKSTINDEYFCIGECPAVDPMDYTVLLPHENCSKFCKCQHGKPTVFVCPERLHFNPEKMVCDFPYRAGCFKSVTTEAPEQTKEFWKKIPILRRFFN